METKKLEEYAIAVGIDGSENSWKALTESIVQAKAKDASLHIVSIQESAEASYSASEVLAVDKTSKANLERAQIKARMQAESEGIKVITKIVTGNSHSTMVAYVKEFKINLLVIGDKGHSSIWSALLGTNAEKVVRDAPCSVLVVR